MLPPDLRITGAGAQALLTDASKARQRLGWQDSDPVRALRRTVEWHLHNPPAAVRDFATDNDFAADDAALNHVGADFAAE